MPIQITWTAVPNGIKDGKLRIVAMASIKLTSPSTTQTTLGAGYPTMLDWHKNKFTFTITFTGTMGVKTFNVGPLAVSSQTAWPALFKSDTPVKPYKSEGSPVRAWESYSVTRLLESSKTAYVAVAQDSLVPKYTKVTELLREPFKAPDVFRSPFFQEREILNPAGIRGGIRGVGGDDEESDYDEQLLAATDYGTGLYGSAREMLAAAYEAACYEWRNEGGEEPEESALWWEARQFFEAYDKNEEEQVRALDPQIRPQVFRPGVLRPEITQKPYVDRYGGTPFAVGRPTIDFHEAVSLLGEHPALMRQLGLIFDLEVPIGSAGLAPTGSVTLAATWVTDGGGNGAAPQNPLTVFQFNAARNVFLPGHKAGAEYKEGFYNLGSEYVQITGVDVDSLAIRTLDFATSIRNKYALNAQTSMIAAMGSVSTPPPTTRPPAATNPAIKRPPTRVITTRPPTSVTRPGATVTPQANTPSTAVTQRPSDIMRQLIYSEALFMKMGDRPDTAAPPGLRSAGVSIARKDRSQKMALTITYQLDYLAKIAAPKTISLYYEDMIRGYRMDVFADGKWHSLVTRQGGYTLPGNIPVPNVDEESWVSAAISSDPAATEAAKKAKVHEVMVRWSGFSLVNQRPSRTLDQQNNVIDGGTVLDPRFPVRMDFKPRPGTLPALRFGKKYRFRLRVSTVAGTGPEIDATSPGAPYETPELTYRRWEAVPSPTFYEQSQTKEGESAGHVVIRKYVASPGTIDPAMRQLVPPAGEVSLAETHGMFDVNGKPDPSAYAKIQERDNMAELGKYVGGKVSRMPYFADPMAQGITVQGAPHVGSALNLSYPGNWPEQQSLQFEVRAGTSASAASGDKFTLFLTPGEIAFPKISSSVPAGAADIFGIMEWVPAANRTAMLAAIPQGRMWTVTPFRESTVLFATQIPEQKPSIDRPNSVRSEGSTSATLTGRMQTHSWTTATVDFNCAYTDDVDLIMEPKRTTTKIDRTAHAFKLKVVRGPSTPVVFQPFSETQEFGDSKHHEVTYSLTADTPFKQYFPKSWPLASDPENTRFTEEVPNAFTMHILASKRPEPPLIEYVVPSFGWGQSASTDGKTKYSSRGGNSLRVYIRRPWYSSGNGEKLAVVILAPTTGQPETEPIRQYTTVIGADPVTKFGDVPVKTTANQFVGGGAAVTASPPDMTGAFATVVPYDVHFDDEKQMWYADITVNVGNAYTPFVRLALARYQQYAIFPLQLSHIKVADIMQLQSSRSASVSFVTDQKIKVSVVGPIGETAAGPNRLFGTIEEKVGADDDTGWRTVYEDGKELTRAIPISAPTLTGILTNPGTILRPPGRIIRPPEEETDSLEASEEQVGGQGRPTVTTQPQIRPGVLSPQIRDIAVLPAGPGEFTLPKPRGQGTYRLVIREYEIYGTDSGDADMPDLPAPAATTAAPRAVGARLVYADVIALS